MKEVSTFCQYFKIYKHNKFHAQLSWAWKKFFNLGARFKSSLAHFGRSLIQCLVMPSTKTLMRLGRRAGYFQYSLGAHARRQVFLNCSSNIFCVQTDFFSTEITSVEELVDIFSRTTNKPHIQSNVNSSSTDGSLTIMIRTRFCVPAKFFR